MMARYIVHGYTARKSARETSTVDTGSQALMMCAKATDPELTEMEVIQKPPCTADAVTQSTKR